MENVYLCDVKIGLTPLNCEKRRKIKNKLIFSWKLKSKGISLQSVPREYDLFKQTDKYFY